MIYMTLQWGTESLSIAAAEPDEQLWSGGGRAGTGGMAGRVGRAGTAGQGAAGNTARERHGVARENDERGNIMGLQDFFTFKCRVSA